MKKRPTGFDPDGPLKISKLRSPAHNQHHADLMRTVKKNPSTAF